MDGYRVKVSFNWTLMRRETKIIQMYFTYITYST